MTNKKLFSKPASVDGIPGDLGAQDRNVLNIHKDPSTKSTQQSASEAKIPKTFNIAIDLDGTLIKEDLTYLAVQKLIETNPLNALRICLWYSIGGRAYCKRKMAQAWPIDPSSLTYNYPLLDYVKKQKNANIALATGADFNYAKAIADHLEIFDAMISSNSLINMTGNNKAAALHSYYKTDDFIYAGNESIDLKVWEKCKGAITVNVPSHILQQVPKNKIIKNFDF